MESILSWRPIEDVSTDTDEEPKSCEWLLLGWEKDKYVEPAFWHDGSENYWKKEGWYGLEDRGNILTAKPLLGATHYVVVYF